MRKPAGHVFLLRFAPEQWDAVTIFSSFPFEGASNKKLFNRGRNAVRDHLEKYRTFASLANKLISGFKTDREQLEKNGYSPANHSKEYAAIVESCICELYSTLDGVRDVIFTVYKDVRGMQKKSNEKLFRKACMNEYGNEFPEELNSILSEAYSEWFIELRDFRTEMIHGSLGSTSMDDETKKIRYFHTGMTRNGNALRIEDFVQFITDMYAKVLRFLDKVFLFLYRCLDLESTQTMCGFYKGRVYERLIEPERTLTNGSGYCRSRQWFDDKPEFSCPLSDNCNAYARAATKL